MTEVNMKKDLRGFRAGFDSLPRKHLLEVRGILMEKCGWSKQSFYHKCNGINKLHSLEIPVIEEVFAEFNIDAWTGEYLT